MSNKLVSIPFEDPFNIPENTIIDFSDINFSDEFNDNISTAFIYLRNVEYCGNIDFSKLSFEEKSQVLKLYMIRDLKDLRIKELDYTLFNIMIDKTQILNSVQYNDLCENSIFNEDELNKFIEENKDLIKELYNLSISTLLYVISLDESKVINYDNSSLEYNEEMPLTYECFTGLMTYDMFSIVGIYHKNEEIFQLKPVFYKRIFNHDNSQLVDLVQNSFIGRLYNAFINVMSLYAKK